MKKGFFVFVSALVLGAGAGCMELQAGQ